jgi:acetolactate synthase-1/3 small subunit
MQGEKRPFIGLASLATLAFRGRGKMRTTTVNANVTTSTSHYPAAPVAQRNETHTLSVLVDNEPGVLARVIGLFAGRGYNIESLTVSETEHQKHLSLITIVTTGTPMVLEQIKNQLDRLVPVHRVVDMTATGRSIERELAMVKVRGKGDERIEALRLADAFRARVVDASTESFVFEITGKSDKIEQFVALMLPLGLVEVSRTGVVAIIRGPEAM